MKTHSESVAALVIAVGVAACSPTGQQLLEQHIAASKTARVQEADYVKGLATAMKEEKRNDIWAAKKESELRSSYAAEKDVPPGALQSVECRSSRCDLQFQLSAEQSPQAGVERQIAINQWIARSQPCGYTITGPGALRASGEVRIFLHCTK